VNDRGRNTAEATIAETIDGAIGEHDHVARVFRKIKFRFS
jgi:hypothetical protein